MFVTSMGRRSRLLLLFLPAHDCWSKPINKAHVVTELNQFKNKSRGSSFHLVWASRNCHKLTKKKKKVTCFVLLPTFPACFTAALLSSSIFFSQFSCQGCDCIAWNNFGEAKAYKAQPWCKWLFKSWNRSSLMPKRNPFKQVCDFRTVF